MPCGCYNDSFLFCYVKRWRSTRFTLALDMPPSAPWSDSRLSWFGISPTNSHGRRPWEACRVCLHDRHDTLYVLVGTRLVTCTLFHMDVMECKNTDRFAVRTISLFRTTFRLTELNSVLLFSFPPVRRENIV